MNLFRRGPKPAEAPHPHQHRWPQVERAPVEYHGIARSSFERADFSPYEFQTHGGVWVRLHDMQFIGFDYQVQPPALTLRFAYNDPQSTPPEARATPVAVLRFSDVQVWQWEDDYDPVGTPAEERGRVSDLGYHPPTNVFSLLTLNTQLLFSASRLAVNLESLDNG